MKNPTCILFIAIIFGYLFANGQNKYKNNTLLSGKWKCDINFDNQMGPFTTFLFFSSGDDSSFQAHSAKNADKRIFGDTKATLARFFKKSPKKGIFLKISNGRIIRKERSDSLYGKIHIPMFGILDFESGIINDSLSGDIIDSTKIVGTITGVKARPDSKIDYGNLMNDIVDTTRKYIFDPQMLQTRKWKKFKKKMSLVFDKATDDIEIFFGFNILDQKLPFSHYNLFLFPQEPDLKTDNKTHNVYLEEKGTNTVYLNIKSFGGTAGDMDSIFNLVFSKHYENMIVDLRNNSGGGINSAIPFGQYLTTKPLDAGVFLTNKWFREHSDKPDRETYLKIPVSRAKTTEGFIDELKNNNARRLVIQPGKKSFRGNIYVLTSHKTASTCEPIVYALKKYGIATIVGEKTAGAMLSATTVQVKGKYYIFLPIADFYTFDGIRIDQHGVEPDIKIKPDEALDYVLENLIK